MDWPDNWKVWQENAKTLLDTAHRIELQRTVLRTMLEQGRYRGVQKEIESLLLMAAEGSDIVEEIQADVSRKKRWTKTTTLNLRDLQRHASSLEQKVSELQQRKD